MPPHLDNTVLWGDFAGQTYYLRKIDPVTGEPTGANRQVFKSNSYTRSTTVPAFGRHIDLQQGPDGSLYLLNHGAGCCNGNTGGQSAYTGIVRISYTGTCADPALYPAGSVSISKTVHRGAVSWFRVGANEISLSDDGSGLMENGSHVIKILDVNGRLVHTIKGEGARTYAMPALEGGKVFVFRAETPLGIVTRTFSRI
jgi:hypothetical protein